MDETELKALVEALLMASESPVSLDRLLAVLQRGETRTRSKDQLRAIIAELRADYAGRGVELVEVASGYRFQSRSEHAEWIGGLLAERKPRYSRALLETLAIIAYRQPITRGEIEHIRGVPVSTHIVRTLLEREWVKVVGHRDVPGRPAVYATTKEFLDYFGLTSLDDLPSLAELKDIDDLNADLFADQIDGDVEIRDGTGAEVTPLVEHVASTEENPATTASSSDDGPPRSAATT